MEIKGGGSFRSLLVILFLLLCSPLTVSAMNRQVIPDSYKDYSLSGRLELTANKYKSHAWHGVAGQVRDSTSVSSTVPNTFGSKLFTIPTVRTGFTYTDFLDIEFENVAEVAGRSLNATLHVDSVTFGPAQRNTVDNSNFASAQAGIFLLPAFGEVEFFFGRGDQGEYFPAFEQRYDAVKDLTVTITVRYADNGQIVPFGFNQRVTDIDCNNRWSSYGATEGVTFGSGYTGNLYTYSNCRLAINGSHVAVPNDGRDHNYSDFKTPPAESGSFGEVYSDDPKVKEASNYMNACWASTTNGQFTVTLHGGNFSMMGGWYTPMFRYNKPDKHATINPSDLNKLDWSIEYKMPKRYEAVFDPLKSFGFVDHIPAETPYTDYDLTLDGANIKNQSTSTYDAATRTLRVNLKPEYLQTNAPYGKTVKLIIHSTWKDGARRATNTPVIHMNEIEYTGYPETVSNPSEVAIGLTKIVLDKKDSYGPGDIVDFFIGIDFESYESLDGGGFNAFGPDTYGDEGVANFQFEDLIPDGMELVGQPKVLNGTAYGGYESSSQSIMSILLRKFKAPLSKAQFEKFLLEERWLTGFNLPAQTVNPYNNPSFHQPAINIPPFVTVDSQGVFQNPENLARYLKTDAYSMSKSLSETFNPNNTYNIHMRSHYDEGVFVPGIAYPDPVLNTSISPNRIAVTSNPDTFFLWTYSDYSIYTDVGYVGIYYQCRIKDGVANTDLTNTTKVSAENVIIAQTGKTWTQLPNSTIVTYTSYHVPVRVPVEAQASATIHVGGYSVTTEVVNGRISEGQSDIPGGANLSVSYSPKPGYYLESVTVDGNPVNINTYKSLYNFQNIRASHHVKVVYAKGHTITTEAVHGQITPDLLGVKPGTSHTITYQPDEGYMLSSVTVDGVAQNISGCADRYTFTNVQADHHIKVVYIPKYKIETEVVNGTITPTITGIAPGEERTVSYSPKNGEYYLKSVTVDGTALMASQLKGHKSSYKFTDIHEDHKIKVVYAKVPVITITKQINGEVVWAKGKPEFSFLITGTDYLGDAKTYCRTLTFSESDGTSKSATLRIPAGQWTVSELPSNDWSLASVAAGSNCTVRDNKGFIDTRNADTGGVTFTNRRSDWSDYTENDTEVNQLK